MNHRNAELGATNLLRHLSADGRIEEPFYCVDVGCSEQLLMEMRSLEPHLFALGVDPLVSEVARLTENEANPDVRFVAAFVGSPRPPQARPHGPNWFGRSSASAAILAAEATTGDKNSYVKEHFNAGARVVYTERRATLSQLLKEEAFPRVDFLKVDTDGFDVEVLTGAARFLKLRPPLLVVVETNFNSEGMPYNNVISAVDSVLRPWGLSLVDIDVWRYTRAALPGPFLAGVTAQTVRGPASYCDVSYYDDPLAKAGKLDAWLARGDLQRCLRLLVLYERFGLQDCAAELICALRDHELAKDAANWAEMLDLLVPPNPMGLTRYVDYIEFFRRDARSFLPTRWGQETTVALETAPASDFYDFADAMIERGEAHTDGDALRIETGAEPWAYAAIVPLRAGPAGRLAKLTLQADVTAGLAEIGILDSEGACFVASQIVGQGESAVSLDLPRSTLAGSLVIRNAGDAAIARLTVQLLEAAFERAQL